MIISLEIEPGKGVIYHGNQFVISRILDTNSVVITDGNGKSEKVAIAKLEPCEQLPENVRDVTTIRDSDWQIAQQRFSIIQPIINSQGNQRELINQASKTHKVGKSTIYRWISTYNETKLVSSLAPEQRSGGKGKSRLLPEIDTIIKQVINEHYLTSQKKSVQNVCNEVMLKCKEAQLEPPHYNTLRHRIALISDYEQTKYRLGRKEARKRFDEKVGHLQDSEFPFSLVEIDHTMLDIMVVDEYTREPIGRPWITLAIDTFSRMVLGFYVGFERPSAMSVGLCVAHAILPKEEWLAQRNIFTEWPCWGVMKAIHLDNAKEFRSKTLAKACQEYRIERHWRPPGRPEFGGHIERLLGTLSTEIHALSGTTFSNIKEKGDYDSEAKAVFSLKELEQWLMHMIVEVYHNRFHNTILKTPLARFKEGLFGDEEHAGVGLPPRVLKKRKVHLDFMPYQERTIQDYGVLIDNVAYYSDTLRPWINAVDKKSGKHKAKQKFIFKRDPRDISVIYFLDPELREYFPIPYRDSSKPAISVWEFRAARERVIALGLATVDEDTIFAAYKRMKEIEVNAAAVTKKTKRMESIREKQREHREVVLDPPRPPVKLEMHPLTLIDFGDDPIEAFDDIDDGTLN
jgi:putative transposase